MKRSKSLERDDQIKARVKQTTKNDKQAQGKRILQVVCLNLRANIKNHRRPKLITEIDEGLWAALVNIMTVDKKDQIVFGLSCGMEIES